MKSTILRWSVSTLLLTMSFGYAVAQEGRRGFQTRPLGEGLPTFDALETPAAFKEPKGELTLRQALSMALLHNPALAFYSWEIRMREASAVQAGTRPNPELAFELENFAGSGDVSGMDGSEATLSLSHLIELGGKRGKRFDAVNLDATVAQWMFEQKRLETYSKTAAAFVSVLAAQEHVELAAKLVEVAENVHSAVSERVRVGAVMAIEKSRAVVALEMSHIEHELAKNSLAVARNNLASMWGGHDPGFSAAIGDIERIDFEVPSWENLISRPEQNSEVARWIAELDLRQAQVALARAISVPDLTVDLGVRRLNDTDDTALVMGISAPLPLFNRNRGATTSAERAVRQAEAARRQAETDFRRDTAVAYEKLMGARDEVMRLRDRVLPEAETAATSSDDAYRAGRMLLTDVLDTQRTFFRLKSRYVSALARYHTAVAEVQSLVGEPIAELEVR